MSRTAQAVLGAAVALLLILTGALLRDAGFGDGVFGPRCAGNDGLGEVLNVDTDEAPDVDAPPDPLGLCSGFVYPKEKPPPEMLAAPGDRQFIKERFDAIYKYKVWDSDYSGGGSGPGSSLANTANVRELIREFVARRGITRFMDAPCGSSFWWPPLLRAIRTEIPCFEYHGVDVVDSVIANNSVRFADDPLTTFTALDVASVPLPKGYQAILSRDALQHLPIARAIDALENYVRAEPDFLLVGSYIDGGSMNRDITVGDYYLINLRQFPFEFPEPEEVLDENYDGKHLLVYSGEQLGKIDFGEMRKRWKEKTGKERRKRLWRRIGDMVWGAASKDLSAGTRCLNGLILEPSIPVSERELCPV